MRGSGELSVGAICQEQITRSSRREVLGTAAKSRFHFLCFEQRSSFSLVLPSPLPPPRIRKVGKRRNDPDLLGEEKRTGQQEAVETEVHREPGALRVTEKKRAPDSASREAVDSPWAICNSQTEMDWSKKMIPVPQSDLLLGSSVVWDTGLGGG